MLYRAYWKRRGAPDKVTPSSGFVRATDHDDAKRIMEENLDTTMYEVKDITEAADHMITPQSITVNFRNTCEYARF
jgi:hypothetical protein